MKTAVYLAITLHFSRKLLGKLRGDPRLRYAETLRRLRELSPDETVVLYENGRKEPLKLTVRSSEEYIYAKMTGQPLFMTDSRAVRKLLNTEHSTLDDWRKMVTEHFNQI